MRYTLKRDDIPLLSQWIKKFDKSKLVEFFWLGMRDLNPRVTESESVALPLGESPIFGLETFLSSLFIIYN